MYAMQCIRHCVFLLFCFLVCVAAAWLLQARARQINTQHSQAYALNTCWLKKKKRRERGGMVVWLVEEEEKRGGVAEERGRGEAAKRKQEQRHSALHNPACIKALTPHLVWQAPAAKTKPFPEAAAF